VSNDTVPAIAGVLGTGAWRLDPTRSSIEFHVRHFYGLMTVKGRFDRYEGRLDLSGVPAVELTIEAASVDTKRAQRDKHLRSEDFFDVANHPQVRFLSDTVSVDGENLTFPGRLHAAGHDIALEVAAQVRHVGIEDEMEIEATATADHRQLGMNWSPLGIMRAPSTLVVRGRMVRTEANR
jgi:polyisoprenoid-binding protein YceI